MAQYHVRRKDLAIEDREALAALIREGKYATLALCQEGIPYAVTMNYGFCEAENALYFHSAASGRKIEALRSNPQACATVIRDEGYQTGRCTHHYTSVVIEGRVEFLETREEKMAGMGVLFRHLEANFEEKEARLAGLPGDLEKVAVFKLPLDAICGKHGNG